MTALPAGVRPPRVEGWFAEDLDHLPEAPRHTELIDGALVFRVAPQRSWHGRLVTSLTVALMDQAPDGIEVEREMTIRLDARNRPEPDLLLATAPYEADRTWFTPEDVLLVIEVVSPESAHRDRTVKLRKYAGPESRTTGASRTRTPSPPYTSTSSTSRPAPTRPQGSSAIRSSGPCPSRSASIWTSSHRAGPAETTVGGQRHVGRGEKGKGPDSLRPTLFPARSATRGACGRRATTR